MDLLYADCPNTFPSEKNFLFYLVLILEPGVGRLSQNKNAEVGIIWQSGALTQVFSQDRGHLRAPMQGFDNYNVRIAWNSKQKWICRLLL
jgi:hypothetical protein